MRCGLPTVFRPSLSAPEGLIRSAATVALGASPSLDPGLAAYPRGCGSLYEQWGPDYALVAYYALMVAPPVDRASAEAYLACRHPGEPTTLQVAAARVLLENGDGGRPAILS